MDISGECAPAFEGVREAFIGNFSDRGDLGAGVAVVHNGRLVVDLWGGDASAAGATPWRSATRANVWSTTKGLTALCFAMLVSRGRLSYEDPVSKHWPEFAAAGKGGVTVGMLLSHQAGLCGFRDAASVEDFYNHDSAAKRLAAAAPFWEPGTACGYHAITIGFLANELFRRVEGRTLGSFIAAELATPFGLDVSMGLPVSLTSMAAVMAASPDLASTSAGGGMDLSEAQIAALANPTLDPLVPNTADWRAAEIPSANGFATARAIAKLYGALASDGTLDGVELVSPRAIADSTRVRIDSDDQVLGMRARWAAGFLRNVHGIYGPGNAAFGHSGWGGSFGFADPERGWSMAYVMNRMGNQLIGDPRNTALVDALYRS